MLTLIVIVAYGFGCYQYIKMCMMGALNDDSEE